MNARLVLTPVMLVCLLTAAAVQAAWMWQPVPLLLRVVPLTLLAITLIRPVDGLLIFAGLSPLAAAILALSGWNGRGDVVLEQLVLAVIIGTAIGCWRVATPMRLPAPALIVASVAAASAIATAPILVLRDAPGASLFEHIVDLLVRGRYFERVPTWVPIHAAMWIVEGLALAVAAERVVRGNPTTVRRVLVIAVLSVTAVAGLNLERIVGAAIRSGSFLSALPDLFLHTRVSRFYDVNAAGSVFVLLIFTAIGLAREGNRIHLWTLGPLVVLGLGLWSSGSRAALASFAVVSAAALVGIAVRRQGLPRWTSAGALAVMAVAVTLVIAFYPATRNQNAGTALKIRLVLMSVAIDMWQSAPVFGIGITRFYPEAPHFGGETLRAALGPLVSENAHNYYLQVLAEFGLAGFIAMLTLLVTTLAAAMRTERSEPSSVRRWLFGGVCAYLLTWLTGHPQLVPEAAAVFWLLFGVLAALTNPMRPGLLLAAAPLAVLLLASGPVRASSTASGLDLENIGVGLSTWRRPPGELPYREAGTRFALYLPSDGSTIVLPARRAPGEADPLPVAIEAPGDARREVVITGDSWQEIAIALRPSGRRFALVRFTLGPSSELAPARDVRIYVGRAEPR